MLHDPVKYPDPESFKPERFFRDDGTLNDDKVQAAFGFGRRLVCYVTLSVLAVEDQLISRIVRVCSGQYLARASIWIMVACTLALFDIEPAKDEAGNEIPVHYDYTDGFLRWVSCDFLQ